MKIDFLRFRQIIFLDYLIKIDMAKKEIKNTKDKKMTAVPLFDDGTAVVSKKKTSATKKTKDTISKTPKNKTVESISNKKDIKDDKRNHSSGNSNTVCSKPASNCNKNTSTVKKAKEDKSGLARQSRTTSSKSTSSSATTKKDRDTVSGSTRKAAAVPDKNTKSAASRKRTHTEDKSVGNTNKRTKRDERPSYEGIEQLRKDYKRLKRKQETTARISLPKTIIWGPYPINADEFLDEIVLDGGEYRQVSTWSIRDGQYHEGLDSEFIVNRLSYPQKNEEDNSLMMLAKFNKKMKTKYIDWTAASHHKGMKEQTIDEYGEFFDWLILFAENNMDNFSAKFKKKYKQKFALRCLL